MLVDAGNTVFSGTRDDVNRRSEGRLLVAAMNLMGYDALAIGPNELNAGPDVLQARMAEAEFAVLSANVELGGRLLAEPYVILDRDGLKVAILGLTSDKNVTAEGYTITDPMAAARKYVPQLRQEADVVIVLSNLGTDDEAALMEAAKGADLFVNGGYAGPSAKTGGALTPAVVRAGGLGEYLGITQVRLGDDNRAVAYGHQSLLLTSVYPDDPDTMALKMQYARDYPAE